MNSIAVGLIQKSELVNKFWFIQLVQEMSQKDFERFGKEIMHLRQFYDTTVGVYATDAKDVFILNEDKMWKIDEVDFDSDVNFKKIS